MSALIIGGAVAVGAAVTAYAVTRKDPMAEFDLPEGHQFDAMDSAAALDAIMERIGGSHRATAHMGVTERLVTTSDIINNMFANAPIVSAVTAVDAGGVPAEWVVAPGVNSDRRLLYIHGGAFYFGSPKSHRVITSKLSEISNAAVLAIDYRLMPEHNRMASVEDCRTAYDWMLQQGPDGAAPATTVYVAGDSAGGNLTLSLLAWVRDSGRRAPNAAVALSPVTDARMVSPSLSTNMDTDIILKPLAKGLNKVPRWLLFAVQWWSGKAKPTAPAISPLLGDLSGLPPILVQVSDHEMLRDDGRRYVNKAVAAGTDATLQRWQHVPHVWQIFYPELPEAEASFEQIKLFLQRHSA